MGNSGIVYDLQICRPGSFLACFVRAQRANEDGARAAFGAWHMARVDFLLQLGQIQANGAANLSTQLTDEPQNSFLRLPLI